MMKCASLFILVAVMAVPAMAADNTWLGVDSTWDNAANWSAAAPPAYDLATDVAVFTGSSAIAQPSMFVPVDPDTRDSSVGGLRFESAGWTVTYPEGVWSGIGDFGVTVNDGIGNIIISNGGSGEPAVMTSTPQTWYIGTGSSLTFSGAMLYNGAPMVKTGAGTLYLTTTNTRDGYGSLTIAEGQLVVDKGQDNYMTGPLTIGTSTTTATMTNLNTLGVGNVMSDDATLTVNAGSTVDSALGQLGCNTLIVNGGSVILGTGKAAFFGKAYYYDAGAQMNTGSITMTGGSITGTPTTNGLSNVLALVGAPGLSSNAADTTATITPGIYFQGGSSGYIYHEPPTPIEYPNAPFDHTINVADGAAAVDLDIQGGVFKDTNHPQNDPNLIKAGLGTLRLGGDINWKGEGEGAIIVNAGTLQYDGTYNAARPGYALEDHAVRNNVVVNDTGTLSGTGTVKLKCGNYWDGVLGQAVSWESTLTVNAGGTLSPGASVGTLHVAPLAAGLGGVGAVLMGGVATPAKWLNQIDANGSDKLAFDAVIVTNWEGPHSLTSSLVLNNGGTTELQVSLLSPFVPTNADVYTIAEGFSSVTGTFANATGYTNSGRVDLGNGGWEGVVTYNANDIQLSNLVLCGDANGNGSVAFNDYQALEQGFGSGDTWAEGDFNGDGSVTFADYQILESHFGYVTPEPASMSLLILGGLALIRRRR